MLSSIQSVYSGCPHRVVKYPSGVVRIESTVIVITGSSLPDNNPRMSETSVARSPFRLSFVQNPAPFRSWPAEYTHSDLSPFLSPFGRKDINVVGVYHSGNLPTIRVVFGQTLIDEPL